MFRISFGETRPAMHAPCHQRPQAARVIVVVERFIGFVVINYKGMLRSDFQGNRSCHLAYDKLDSVTIIVIILAERVVECADT